MCLVKIFQFALQAKIFQFALQAAEACARAPATVKTGAVAPQYAGCNSAPIPAARCAAGEKLKD
jgi:hypothetical protein